MSNKRKIFAAALRLLFAEVCSRCMPRTNIWLISERPTQARDNGYCFYKYMIQEQKNQPVIYLIDKQAPDYEKIRQLGGKAVQFNSFRHYLYYCRSKVHISAHVNGCCPDYAISASRRLKHRIGFKDIFLPHGVSYGISEFCLKKYADINLFICSCKPEYDNVLANYGYTPEEVAYTGFPRLDGWHNIRVNKKQIVLMPTWRAYLAQNPNTMFEETAFFHAYQELIQDPKLGQLLEKADIKLIFYLHNDMRKYVNSFHTDCSNIEIVYKDDTYDIQELLKSSALMITDYSSVHFDFAYMGKPVIYYQFDKEEFFDKQYKQSFFDAGKDGFGSLCNTKEEVINQIDQLSRDDFQMPQKYYDRMRKFYPIYDEKNCQRVCQAIRNCIGEGK